MASTPSIYILPPELTLATVDAVRAAVVPLLRPLDETEYKGRPEVILDLAPTQVVTTPGIGLLLELKQLAGRNKGVLLLASPHPRVLDVICRTQLDRVLTVVATVEEARVRLSGC